MRRGGGKGPLVSEEKSFTLASSNFQTLFVPQNGIGNCIIYESHPADARIKPVSVSPTVTVRWQKGSCDTPLVRYPLVSEEKSLTLATGNDQVLFSGVGVENGIAGTLDASYYKGQGVRGGIERTAVYAPDKARSLKASGGDIGGGSESIVCQKTVRRLTPIEAERLQGLPDNYTLIDDKSCSDTARYKALGNGMAQPNADYVIKRIVEVVGHDS